MAARDRRAGRSERESWRDRCEDGAGEKSCGAGGREGVRLGLVLLILLCALSILMVTVARLFFTAIMIASKHETILYCKAWPVMIANIDAR